MKTPTILWALFGFDGRINRQVYWLANLGMGFLALAFAMPKIDPETEALIISPAFVVVLLPALWSQIAIAVKRLHDRNLTGWFAIAFFIPIIQFLAFVGIGLIPGDPGPNQFGRATNQRG